MSLKSQFKLLEDMIDEDSDSENLQAYLALKSRPEIDENMDNLKWQQTALKIHALRELYNAKCRDLRIPRNEDN